jgi:hypothetical protein
MLALPDPWTLPGRTRFRQVLVIVYPDDTHGFGAAQIDRIDAYSGRCVVLLFDGGRGGIVQRPLRATLARLVERGQRVLTVAKGAFGNQRGLPLPVDAAMAIMRTAGLQPGCDSVVLTGCRGGERAGSVDLLADALAALHVAVRIEPPPER